MSKEIYKKISIFIILVFFIQSDLFAIENKIVLKIENQIITKIDISREMQYLIALNPNLANLDQNKIFNIAKNSLIREKIKETEILKYSKINVKSEYTNNIIERIYNNLGFKSKKEFKLYLKNFNLSMEIIEKKLSSEAIWNQIIYSKYNSKLKIDKNKILEEIKKNKQFNNSFLLSEILFTSNSNDEIDTISKKIKASIEENGFENTASIFSVSDSAKTGGNIGWVNETTINKNLLSKISKLEIGEFTKPILVPGGFLILRVNDKKK